MTMIDPDRVGPLEPPHPRYQVRLRGLQQQVIVVAHQYVRLGAPTGSLARLAQRAQEFTTVLVIQDNRLTTVPAAHPMIHRSGRFNSRLPRHRPTPYRNLFRGQYLDPRTGTFPRMDSGDASELQLGSAWRPHFHARSKTKSGVTPLL